MIARISTAGGSIDVFELENPSECTVTMFCKKGELESFLHVTTSLTLDESAFLSTVFTVHLLPTCSTRISAGVSDESGRKALNSVSHRILAPVCNIY
jgi:hypothetical protein